MRYTYSKRLRDILLEKDPALHRRLLLIEEKAEPLLNWTPSGFPTFTSHTFEHSRAVEYNLDKLVIPDHLKEDLNNYEIFFLILAAWLHDWGRICTKDEDPEEVQRSHHLRTEENLQDQNKLAALGLEYSEGPIIGKICRGHARVGAGENLHGTQYDNRSYAIGETIRIRRLAAALKIADKLDVQNRRFSYILFLSLDLSGKSRREWEKLKIVSGLGWKNNDPSSRMIILDGSPRNLDEILKLREVQRKIQSELAEVEQIFEDWKIPLRYIELNVPPSPDDLFKNSRRYPNGIDRICDEMHKDGQILYHEKKYSEAEDLYKDMLERIQKAEIEYGKAIYKGLAFYWIGRCLVDQGKTDDEMTLLRFLWAYIEDSLSADWGQEDLVDWGQDHLSNVGEILRGDYKIDSRLLRDIKSFVIRKKRNGYWIDIKDPNDILKEVAGQFGYDYENFLALCSNRPKPVETLPEIPGKWEKRVFINTRYKPKRRRSLREIKDIIIELGYEPIIVEEIMRPRDSSRSLHDYTLLLLHSCRFAIFEVSDISSFVMEIERVKDYDTHVLLVHDADSRGTQSLESLKRRTRFPIESYENFQDLKGKISKFLT